MRKTTVVISSVRDRMSVSGSNSSSSLIECRRVCGHLMVGVATMSDGSAG